LLAAAGETKRNWLLNRCMVSRDTVKKVFRNDSLYDRIDLELKAVGGVNYYGLFQVNSAAEFFGLLALVLGLLVVLTAVALVNGANLIAVALAGLGLFILTYNRYAGKVKKYKARVVSDTELPLVLQTIANAVEVGIPFDNAIRYIVRTKKGIIRDIMAEAVAIADTGVPLEEALLSVADRALNRRFLNLVRIVGQAKKSNANVRDLLLEQIDEIDEEARNAAREKMGKLNTKLFFPIFVGFFIPTIALVALPMLISFMGLGIKF